MYLLISKFIKACDSKISCGGCEKAKENCINMIRVILEYTEQMTRCQGSTTGLGFSRM